MIAKTLQVIQIISFICALIVAGWFGYRIHQQVARVEAWVSKLDGILGDHSKWFKREQKSRETIEEKLRELASRFRSGAEPGGQTATPQCINPVCNCEDCDCKNCECNLEFETKPLKPTVIMQSMDGCGPCADWMKNVAPNWERAGWDVREEKGSDAGPFPWFRVWDGEKWLVIRERLTLDAYRKAGGR